MFVKGLAGVVIHILVKVGVQKSRKTINMFKLEKAIPSNLSWDKGHRTEPGKFWFCSRRAEMRGGIRRKLGV